MTALRTLLLRTAVLTGGCAAGIILSLSISGEAHADDRPRPLDGLVRDTITEVVDVVLPNPGQPAEESEPDSGDSDPGRGSDEPPSGPVKDIVEDVVGGVEDTVTDVVDTVATPPAADEPAQDTPADPQPETTISGPVDATEQTPAIERPDPTPAPAQVAAYVDLIGAHRPYELPDRGHACGDDGQHADRDEPKGPRRTVRVAIERRAVPAATGYTQPTPRKPSGPDQDAAPAVGTPCTAYTGLNQDATLAARASQPRTTAVRIPGRDQAADGMTRRPDAPSG